MAQVSPQSLALLIQVLDRTMWALRQRAAALDDDSPLLSDLEQELMDYSRAERELQQAYEAATRGAGNFPPYAALVRHASMEGDG